MSNTYKERHPDTLYPISDLQEEDGLILLWELPLDKPPTLVYAGEVGLADDQEETARYFSVVSPINSIVHNGVTTSYEWYEKYVLGKKE